MQIFIKIIMWPNSRSRRFRKILSVILLVTFVYVFKQVVNETFTMNIDNNLRWPPNPGDYDPFHQNSSGVLQMKKNPADVSSFQPFVVGQPKFLVIMAYQRTGSTFLGKFLSEHPNAFYMFEPIDSLYSSLYGTLKGWNVPSDITNYRNGSQRVLPNKEITKVAEFLRSLLNCDLSSLPTDTFVHPHLIYTFVKEFSIGVDNMKCPRHKRKQVRECNTLVPWRYCGSRFLEQSEERLRECQALMTDSEYRRNHRQRTRFDRYLNCTSHLRVLIDNDCIQGLLTTCLSRPIRVAKVVRATMDSMEPLLRDLPNFRLLHLLRDPRAVALSRTKFDSSALGQYSEADRSEMTLREAGLYCQTVVRDLKTRVALERKYPGKILTFIYEDLVRNVNTSIRHLYRFLNLEIPDVISERISLAANSYIGITSAKKWQTVLNYKTCKDIWATCGEFFRTVSYNWEV